MRYRLNSEVVQTASLKTWDFVCRYERASRSLRVKLARAAKHRSRQLMKTEIETYEDDLSPRCKTHRTRRYPSKCVRVCMGWGGSKYSVSIWLVIRLPLEAFLEDLRADRKARFLNGEDLRSHLNALAAKHPALRSFPVRFINCPRVDLPGWEVLP